MLSNKVALITGGARGIGLATARLLLKNGAKVSIVDVSEGEGTKVCSGLQQEFSKKDVVFLQADVSVKEDLRSVFGRTKEVFGGLHIVCNNAGIGNEKKWRQMLDINLVAVMEGTFLGLEHMSVRRGGQGGTIINVSSFGGIVPMPKNPAYSASKHGVVGFTRSMTGCARKDSVRVNCICPEFVNTRMVTEGLASVGGDVMALVEEIGLLEPETVAEAMLELIMDTSKAGRVMTVTKSKGWRYIHLLGDSKL